MFSSSKNLRKNFFPVYKGFISVQPSCLINLKSAKVTIAKTLTRLKALGLETVAVWSQTGKQTSVSALEQSHPSDGWTRWLSLLAASTVRLLSAAALQWSPYKLWAAAESLTGGNCRSHHNSVICIPRPCSSVRWSFPQLLSIARKLVGFENLLLFARW